MSSERHEELATRQSLGLLDRAEEEAFAAEVAADRELQALVKSLHETTANLAFAAAPHAPPPELRARILAAAKAQPGSPRAGERIAFPLLRLVPWAAAACFALAALWFGLQSSRWRNAAERLETERELAEIAYRMAQNELKERTLVAERMIADLGAQLQRSEDLGRLRVTALASLLGNSPEARAIAVWDPQQESGLLTAEKLPAIQDDQDYQIWVVDPAYPIPVDGGVFKPAPDGRATLTFKGNKPIKTVAAFAISLEKRGGVPKAEGPMVLLGK